MNNRFDAGNIHLLLGDNSDALTNFASIESCVTDPPYGLSFMGKKWDYDVPTVATWQLVLAALKPGAHLLSFAGTRTQHRMACRIEDAGFEIRDMIAWCYGSGFPKSLDVSKAIDRSAGKEREIIGTRVSAYGSDTATGERSSRPDGGAGLWVGSDPKVVPLTGAPATEAAKQWSGWGTALKPAMEPITLARKPLGEATVASNVLKHGTGAINIEACRVGTEARTYAGSGPHNIKLDNHGKGDTGIGMMDGRGKDLKFSVTGRWPANLCHDGSAEVLAGFPETSSGGGDKTHKVTSSFSASKKLTGIPSIGGDTGSAARFFYCAKSSKSDRGTHTKGALPLFGIDEEHVRNSHPTVKPTDLMQYLVRLVTPPGGTVLDPWMGSGSTGVACIREGFGFIGIERDPASYATALERIQHELTVPKAEPLA